MKAIYYSTNSLVFGSLMSDFEQCGGCIVTHSISEAKVALFSGSAKRILLVSDDADQCFEAFADSCQTIRAGGGVVVNSADETLMIRRNDNWDLPKGKLELGETIEQCSVREVEEECGIHGVRLGDFRGQTAHFYKLDGQPILKLTSWWDMTYDGSELPTPQAIEGITAAVWVPRKELLEHISQSYLTIQNLFANDQKQ